jgi:hypothetical protein
MMSTTVKWKNILDWEDGEYRPVPAEDAQRVVDLLEASEKICRDRYTNLDQSKDLFIKVIPWVRKNHLGLTIDDIMQEFFEYLI